MFSGSPRKSKDTSITCIKYITTAHIIILALAVKGWLSRPVQKIPNHFDLARFVKIPLDSLSF